MSTIRCETCRTKLEIHPDAIGTVQVCPKCSHFVDLRPQEVPLVEYEPFLFDVSESLASACPLVPEDEPSPKESVDIDFVTPSIATSRLPLGREWRGGGTFTLIILSFFFLGYLAGDHPPFGVSDWIFTLICFCVLGFFDIGFTRLISPSRYE